MLPCGIPYLIFCADDSLLPSLSKLFEKIVYAQIYEYLIKYKLIHPNQSGFRSKHSCATALTKIVDHIVNHLYTKEKARVQVCFLVVFHI
jgi:hypothetical protein